MQTLRRHGQAADAEAQARRQEMKCKSCGKKLENWEVKSGYKWCEKCAKKMARDTAEIASHLVQLPSFGELQMPRSLFDDD